MQSNVRHTLFFFLFFFFAKVKVDQLILHFHEQNGKERKKNHINIGIVRNSKKFQMYTPKQVNKHSSLPPPPPF